jgi:hypothetical protein
MGGVNGVHVEIPEALFVTSGHLEIKVCDDDGCETATQVLAVLPRDAPTPVGRGGTAPFGDLGRRFLPGKVTVTSALYDGAGRLVAEQEDVINLERSFPNGRACDGEGFVGGGVRLSPGSLTNRAQNSTRADMPPVWTPT